MSGFVVKVPNKLFDKEVYQAAMDTIKKEGKLDAPEIAVVFQELAKLEDPAIIIETREAFKDLLHLKATDFKTYLNEAKKKLNEEYRQASQALTISSNELPTIFTSEGYNSKCEKVREGLEQRNNPAYLFEFDGRRVRLEQDRTNIVRLENLTYDDLSYECNRAVVYLTKDEDKERVDPLPKGVVQDLFGQGTGLLPFLRKLSFVPLHNIDGEIHNEAGYAPDSHIYYVLDGCSLIAIPEKPSEGDLKKALDLILVEALGLPVFR